MAWVINHLGTDYTSSIIGPLHAVGFIPFAPAVPILQKLVILFFAVWAVLQLGYRQSH